MARVTIDLKKQWTFRIYQLIHLFYLLDYMFIYSICLSKNGMHSSRSNLHGGYRNVSEACHALTLCALVAQDLIHLLSKH